MSQSTQNALKRKEMQKKKKFYLFDPYYGLCKAQSSRKFSKKKCVSIQNALKRKEIQIQKIQKKKKNKKKNKKQQNKTKQNKKKTKKKKTTKIKKKPFDPLSASPE